MPEDKGAGETFKSKVESWTTMQKGPAKLANLHSTKKALTNYE